MTHGDRAQRTINAVVTVVLLAIALMVTYAAPTVTWMTGLGLNGFPQQAGAVLQKLRNYGVRLAVVAQPDSLVTSRRFAELAAAERRDRAFCLFDSRAAALAWLAE